MQIFRDSIFKKIDARSLLWRQISSLVANCTVQKVKFSDKDFFSKYKQICSFLRIFSCWFHCMKSVRMRSFLVRIFPQETLRISPYSVQMWENIDQKNSEYGFFHAMLKKYLKETHFLCKFGSSLKYTPPDVSNFYCPFI